MIDPKEPVEQPSSRNDLTENLAGQFFIYNHPEDDPSSQATPNRQEDISPRDSPPNETEKLMSGVLPYDRLGRYKLLYELGRGGFGIVYRAYDEELKRSVAIKLPRNEAPATQDQFDIYLEEARAIAELDHPNIIPVYDIGRLANHSFYIVSKFIDGECLSKVIQRGRLHFDEIVDVLLPLADALSHIHKHKIVHRDLKPNNILLDQEGRPYLGDFGLAIREHHQLIMNQVAGTPAYMSPEMARGEFHHLDGRSDLFSFGIIIYEMITGHRPFQGNKISEILEKICQYDPVPPHILNDRLPPHLEKICLKCLAKHQSNRYQMARELFQDLRNLQKELSHEKKTVVGPQPSADSARS